MTDSAPFISKFILDKAHFNECYQQTNTLDRSVKGYLKAAILMLLGLCILLFTQVNVYAAWFMIGLGILEAASIYYHQPWWVLRQMLAKASNSEVTVTIDERGILNESFYHSERILWQDITQINESAIGFTICFSLDKTRGKRYLSKHCLSAAAIAYIRQKQPTTAAA